MMENPTINKVVGHRRKKEFVEYLMTVIIKWKGEINNLKEKENIRLYIRASIIPLRNYLFIVLLP